MSAGKTILIILLSLIFLIGFGFALEYVGLVKYRLFAPMWEDSKREVFENSQSYMEGKRQEIDNYMYEYNTTDDEQERIAIRTIVVHQFANVDKENLFPHQRTFLDQMRMQFVNPPAEIKNESILIE